jgi:mono/diheme cytochrome c family protein
MLSMSKKVVWCGLSPAAVVLLLHTTVDAGEKAPRLPAHPVVPAFERFYTAADADGVKGGQLLLGELNCTSCHKAEPAHEGYIARKQAPILDGVGNRVKRAYLRKFLSDPQAVKPGTTMPHLFAADADKDKKVEALVHFLASTGSLVQERPVKKLVGPGRDLYKKVGCIACHGDRDAAGNQGKFFATSIPLGDLKAKYSLHSLRTFLEHPQHTRPSGRMPTLLNTKEAQEVAHYLLQGATPDSFGANFKYAYYEGSWQKLPDFDQMKPLATGITEGFDLSVARRMNDMGLKFEGFLRIRQEGTYKFHLTSDDGSKLFINGKTVVNNDWVHPPQTKSGSVKLTNGMHPFKAVVFNAGGGVELNVDIEGPGLGRQAVSPHVFLTFDGAPKTPKVEGKKDEESFALQPELIDQGRTLFSTMGCASCHQLNEGKKKIEAKLSAPALAKLQPAAGCLEQNPKKGLPSYSLTAVQRGALAAAIKTPAPAEKPRPAEVSARTLTTFNCYACHQRDKVGGVEEQLNPFFTTAQPEMGDEGRLPPSLNGVGTKFNTPYLKQILDKGSHDRPYMHTRMPGFGDANVGHIIAAFEAVDSLDAIPKVAFTAPLGKVKAEARHMVGGTSLGCIKCHTFAGNKAEGVQGIDMLLLPQRLKRDYFHKYVADPSKLRPGTRMPASWPDGKSVLPKVLGGDSAQQIEAIWVYLSDGKNALLPLGLGGKAYLPLVPENEAIVYRNFIQGGGPRSIAVGYPEKAHLTFDANGMRLAMIWQGAFMNAGRHWTGRGEGFEPPLGDNILNLPAGVSFAVLAKDDEAWPTKSAKELGYQFKGYRLSADQRPTFLYSFNDIAIEDFPNAVSGKVAPALKRTLTLSADKADKLYFRAAVADKIEAAGDGWYRIGEWKMRIESADTPRLRQSAGKSELLVPLRFKDGKATMVQEFAW